MTQPETAASALLAALADGGVDYLFANAGTDFPPLIEALARLGKSAPRTLTIPHESVAVGMAHGAYLVSGRAQGVMVHVNVGLANCMMGLINARSDDVPMLVMSGRTPLTETGRKGTRMTPIQYGQEMYDQSGLVRELVKFDYELRYPEQAEPLVHRALALARSAPPGPVYLSLPKEPLSEPLPEGAAIRPPAPAATAIAPDSHALDTVLQMLRGAENPAIVCQRGDPAGHLGPLVSRLAERVGAAVYEPFSIRNLLPAPDPALQGYTPPRPDHDVLLVLDSQTPWIEQTSAPDPSAQVIHIAPDPHFSRLPVRGFRCDVALSADPVQAVEALLAGIDVSAAAKSRFESGSRSSLAAQAAQRNLAPESGPMSAEWLSHCVGRIMDEQAVAFSELGLLPAYLDLKAQNRHFSNAHSGGLGWAFPAALGAQLMQPDHLTIACMGDGSYMFANPVACHQVAEALGLPILTIVKNNGLWNAVRRSVVGGYPDGAAAQMNAMPLTDLAPLPDFTAIARASRGHAERVETGADLPAALDRAIRVIREERRPALLDCRVAVSDIH